METTILTPLNGLEDSLNTLITSLTTTNTFTGSTSAAHEILSADEALTSALTTLKQHQDNYNTILKLKAQADQLRSQLKDTIRTCNNLRNEIGQINPAILEDSDSEDDDTPPAVSDIDYDTLLSFAARIGKHNAAAAREAEQESTRRRVQASKNKSGSTTSSTQVNGDTTNAGTGAATGTNTTQDERGQTATQESQAALSAINEALSFQRAAAGMAFPAPDQLRMGVLGQLQLVREQGGEDAVEREVERLVRASEAVTKQEDSMRSIANDNDDDAVTTSREPESSSLGQTKQEEPRAVQARPQPPKEQKKINLDFDEFNSDEDD